MILGPALIKVDTDESIADKKVVAVTSEASFEVVTVGVDVTGIEETFVNVGALVLALYVSNSTITFVTSFCVDAVRVGRAAKVTTVAFVDVFTVNSTHLFYFFSTFFSTLLIC